jgi:uncharacterized protein YjbI with pentapeptide repeats
MRADLSGANLGWANLMTANLADADLSGADLSVADLEAANLGRANLSGANLSDSNLSRANLVETDLSETNLSGANLSGADLEKSNLSRANVQWTNLLWANLNHADLSGADLSGANLNLANFAGAIMAYTVFGDLDLSGVKGLDTTKHRGPSTISIDTIYRSKGNIPESFLRGAGVPDVFIRYVTSLATDVVRYYSCFISFAHQDKVFAQRLHADLQQNGVRCWLAPEDLKIGARIRPTLNESIRVHDKLLLVLSEHSVGSQWAEQEVESALAQEQQQNEIILFPLRLDGAVAQVKRGWLALMQDKQHPIRDFSVWQDDQAYARTFQQLLQALKTD